MRSPTAGPTSRPSSRWGVARQPRRRGVCGRFDGVVAAGSVSQRRLPVIATTKVFAAAVVSLFGLPR
eukprot:3889088-Lingulodinium_polyedra.AAC.1